MIKRRLNTRNVFNILFFAAVMALLFIPPAKAILIRGLMAVGFFQPEVSVQPAPAVQAKEIIFRDNSGKVTSLSSLKGKVVFINFWATWCPPCLAELPSVNALHQKLSDNQNIVFLIVDADNDLGRSVPFIKKHNYNLPVVETVGNVPKEMLGGSIPTTLVINKQGGVVFHHERVASYDGDKFVKYLQQLAAE